MVDIKPIIETQLDTATFPDHDITDITTIVIDGEVTLSIDADCGTAVVNCTEIPSVADDRVRLYLYKDSVLFFNGEITGDNIPSNKTYGIKGQDVLARLKKRWGGADRSYGAGNLPDPSTDTNTVQNIAEASSVDVSLTDIEGTDFPIGISANIIIKGGTPDPLNINKPAQGDVMLDLVKELDTSVVPNYCTFTTGAGVVTRRPRTLGTSIATFGVTDAWDWSNEHQVDTIVNKATVIGKTIANIPTQATTEDSNVYLPAPFEFNPVTINSPRVIETIPDAQDLADEIVAEKNGRLHKVSLTMPMTTTQYLAETITLNAPDWKLDNQDVLVTGLKHRFDRGTATTTFSCEYRTYP